VKTLIDLSGRSSEIAFIGKTLAISAAMYENGCRPHQSCCARPAAAEFGIHPTRSA
jgi:hypothetical protein